MFVAKLHFFGEVVIILGDDADATLGQVGAQVGEKRGFSRCTATGNADDIGLLSHIDGKYKTSKEKKGSLTNQVKHPRLPIFFAGSLIIDDVEVGAFRAIGAGRCAAVPALCRSVGEKDQLPRTIVYVHGVPVESIDVVVRSEQIVGAVAIRRKHIGKPNLQRNAVWVVARQFLRSTKCLISKGSV